MYIDIPSLPIEQAIVSQFEGDYGFSFVDLGLLEQDLDIFLELNIDQTQDFNVFCGLNNFVGPLKSYLTDLGQSQQQEVVEKCARIITDIASKVLHASQKEYAWFCLRAYLPTKKFDIPRWHIDGNYYATKEKIAAQYKFITTLRGPATLFYPLPKSYKKMRQIVRLHMADRPLMAELFGQVEPYATKRGEGAFLVGLSFENGGYHSEPPTHEKRLVFSMVPCHAKHLSFLEKRINEHYSQLKSKEKNNP